MLEKNKDKLHVLTPLIMNADHATCEVMRTSTLEFID